MLMDWLQSPEAQTDPHYWLATAAGHVLIGAVVWGVLAWGLWRVTGRPQRLVAALAVAVAYAAVEGAEWRFWTGTVAAGLQDAALDWLFVAGGAGLAWATWAHRLAFVVSAMAVLAALALRFAPKGKRDDDV